MTIYHPDNPTDTRPVFVATVRLFDSATEFGNYPLARVRYASGRRFISWAHVRHDRIQRATGETINYWFCIDTWAAQIIDQIQAMVAAGHIPPVVDFSSLHDHFDANSGWGPVIDNLSPDDFAAVQWRVTDRLRTN
ncbi:hypothetical protein KIH27_18540 [Mycobacterium sp. M1]|uniref:Uncharacterized protein n=1 Tax=Mycolicibacter acidiphilus TaxID=2835306 RepID=A0ABS5RMQ6_9MYCO|nr:hypothetical protein [Mycolicibacter acidiphilus]MBS9535588.1 hypothetical protein [Mycolicibacter acidiphilus]